ncbi:glycoside hydrolase family 38 C-terminal domain-containing protein [Coraliomargarita sp. SDUM461004]|uniref:Glycoside hydrolase family 38 C-terminal domain-containing protein n=1 Tax=Thalassobacterium sedimentorum TaxID=3041258 RepID=A0ABU1AN49_9BACT|nr:glycoside hydrolase family 38 C-terminal domain-containing protein [Coraliomargarita sp. SDUM461004]MDQ8196132.1 glycoside hydrolase family 38 C-terminal domain-containing protein [Coraliomargarita sp. SDUM461004]
MSKSISSNHKVAPRKIFYVLSTHWDREWYQTFQDYRRRLVHLLDGVIDDLESGDLKGAFTTDGHTAMIDDYLEVRPHQRDRVMRLIQDGSIKVGPWFVLPDEWVVSGESLIRNLQLGRKQAKEWGGQPSDAGIVCDQYGHIGQLPQIFQGFGISMAFVWRGLEPRRSAHVRWAGVDGTEIICYRFGRNGYVDYATDVRRVMSRERKPFDAEAAKEDLSSYLAKEADRNAIPPILVYDGGDHLEYESEHYKLLMDYSPGDRDNQFEVIHASLDDYIADVHLNEDDINDRISGELREPGRLPLTDDAQWFIPGALSSRIWIKQRNAHCQTLLCQWAEPFSAMANQFTGESAQKVDDYLSLAWRWLILNHPHDSMCGSCIDAAHDDMRYRFAQSEQISTTQTEESLKLLAASVLGEVAANEVRVLVANPLARAVDEPIDLVLQLPEAWGCFNEFFGYELKPAFRIYDAEGQELPYQLLAQAMDRKKKRIDPIKFPASYKTNDVSVCVRLEIPAVGYTTLTVREGDSKSGATPKGGEIPAIRHSQYPGLATSGSSMENEFLSVFIEPNGTLSITDKRNGEVYSRLLSFEDVADIGDGWYHGPVVNDRTCVSLGASADISLLHNGASVCSFRICLKMNIPKRYELPGRVRSEELVSLEIENTITLRAGCSRLEVLTAVNNVAEDHRLRLIFPTNVTADHYYTDGVFDVVERPVALPENNHLGREPAVETVPQQSWTAVSKQKRGLAVISSGLLESTVRDLPDRPLALTLFRAIGRTFLTDGEPGGQLRGRMEFPLWIVPFDGEPDRRSLCDAGVQLAASFRNVQLHSEDLSILREAFVSSQALPAPASTSFIAVDGHVALTSFRELVSGCKSRVYELRLFNPYSNAREALLHFPHGKSTAIRVDLDGNTIGDFGSFEQTLAVSFKAKEIITLRITSD